MSKISYVWNAEDARIATTGAKDSVQGAFVTPYGIQASALAGCKEYKAGTTYDGIELDLCMGGEPWRGSRFREATTARTIPGQDKSRFKWDKFDVPASVDTLKALCEHLRKTDPDAYPETIYGDRMLANLSHPDNPAKLLFDYWGNSPYRYAVVSEGFDWKTYADDPGSIPVRKGSAKLEYVMRKVKPLPPAAGGPGEQKKTIDDPGLEVDHYISELATAAANLRTLFKTSQKVMLERYQIVYQLQALRAIAWASWQTPQGSATSQGDRIVTTIDRILPQIIKAIVAQPIKTGNFEQQVQSLFSARKDFTMDALADMNAEERRLRHLLLESEEHANIIKDWAKANHGELLKGNPHVAELLDRLTATQADATLALGECVNADDDPKKQYDNTFEALLAKLKDGHASSPDDIGGTSPVDVVLSLVGKGVSITTTVVGNLAGPPSLSIAALQVYALRRFPKIVAEGLGAVAAVKLDFGQLGQTADSVDKWFLISRSGTSVQYSAYGPELDQMMAGMTAINTKFSDLAGKVLGHMPDGETKKAMMDAFVAGDQKALAGFKDQYGEAIAGAKQNTVAWKGGMVLLNLVSTILAIRNAASSGSKHPVLVINDYVSVASGVTSVSLGAYETFLTAVGRLEPVSKGLALAGNIVGGVTAVTGLISGAASYVDAINKQDWAGVASASFAIAGSAGMAVVAVFGALGTSMPLLSAVALACLLASGAISLAQIADAVNPSGTKTNHVCYRLIRAVRDSFTGKLVEQNYGSVLLGMEEMEKIAKEGLLPNIKNDFFVISALVKAGVPLDAIRDVVNAQALANTPFGPGLAPGFPAAAN